MMTALGYLEMIGQARFEPPIIDLDTTREVRALCDAGFAKLTLEQAGARLDEVDLAWAPMSSLADLANSDMAEAAGCFIEVEDGWGGTFRAPASPARFPEGAPPVGRAAPKLGEHTREILEAAGLRPDEIEALI
jgi:crotonobetainyl-CoA:carnitine CoA-transferase CaiB-like acyl-CoA transferase